MANESSDRLVPGLYRHYKGGFYRVFAVGFNSNNGPDVGREEVIYYSLEKGKWHNRSAEEFTELVQVYPDGPLGLPALVARFQRVGD